MDKLLFFSKDKDNLSIGFHREITTREKEMTNNEKQEEFILLEFLKTLFLTLQCINQMLLLG